MQFLFLYHRDMKNKVIKSIYDAVQLLKSGYTLVILENKTAVAIKKGLYFLISENWHTKMNEQDFMEAFENNTFIIWETKKDDGISVEKDEEYYAWRSKYL